MPQIAIIGDTHIPSRAAAIPEWVESALREADHVIHTGDFTSREAYERVESLASGNLTAVSGNMDPAELSLPAIDSVVLGGRTFVVFHGTGSPHGYEDRVREAVRDETDDPDPIAVSGHTHEILDSTDGLRILNPGSATGAPPATVVSMMWVTASDGDLSVEVRRG